MQEPLGSGGPAGVLQHPASAMDERRATMHTMLIDTHTHLDDVRYNDERDAMIARAQDAGVSAFITIGCDLATSRSAVELAGHHPFVYAAVGVRSGHV